MNSNTGSEALAFTSSKDILFTSLLSAGYLALSYLLIGFRPEQLFLAALFNMCYYASRPSRKFVLGFSIFIVYWIIFDYMKAFPNYLYNEVHIGSLYELEKSVFGIAGEGQLLTPNEYWLRHSSAFLDGLAGFMYLSWVPVPLAFAAWLFYTRKEQFLHFSLSFLLVNLIGFVIYYIYPAAPPWYIQQQGLEFHAHTAGNTAGLARFDQLFHAGIFQSIYAKSSNVFAAMPSLHASYPVIVLYYGLKNRLGLINLFFAIVMLGIWFAAVYSSHHYVLDVMAGIACALGAILIFRQYFLKRRWFMRFLDQYLALIR